MDSQYEHDYLRFYIDGVEKLKISDSTSWAHKIHYIGDGPHTLRWEYTKDGSGSTGEDCGWVDEVVFIERCSAEFAVYQAGVPDPDSVLNTLRAHRKINSSFMFFVV